MSKKPPDFTLDAFHALISVWGKHHARVAIGNYVQRIAFAFQPGLTPEYLKYVCELPFNAETEIFQENTLAPQTQNKFTEFLADFSEYQQSIFILNDDSNDTTINEAQNSKGIVICHTRLSPADCKALQKILAAKIKNLCLVVLAEPIFAFKIESIQKSLSIRIRQVIFPMLGKADKLRAEKGNPYIKAQSSQIGIPLISEGKVSAWKQEEYILNEFALWRRADFRDITPLYLHLFMFVKSGRQLYANMAITLNSPYSILDTAATLGFTVLPAKMVRESSEKEDSEHGSEKASSDDNRQGSSKDSLDEESNQNSSGSEKDDSGSKACSDSSYADSKRSSTSSEDEKQYNSRKSSTSDSSNALFDLKSPSKGAQVPVRKPEKPYVIKALPALIKAFTQDFPAFSAFDIIQAHQQLWQEAERAIIRVMADGGELNQTMGKKWPFLVESFVAHHKSYISRVPLVLPKVTKRTKTPIDKQALDDWIESGDTTFPVQNTMKKSCWPTILKSVPLNCGLYPVEKSKGPDYAVVFRDEKKGMKNMLCFQVKSGVQDLSIEDLKIEIGKCPFIDYENGDFIWTGDEQTTITFVYVAANHRQIKTSLRRLGGVEKTKVYFRITHATQDFGLPHNIEVVMLRQPGMQSLFGNEAYERLVRTESLVSFAEAEKNIWTKLIEQFRARPRKSSAEEFREKLRELLASAEEEHGPIALEEVERRFNYGSQVLN